MPPSDRDESREELIKRVQDNLLIDFEVNAGDIYVAASRPKNGSGLRLFSLIYKGRGLVLYSLYDAIQLHDLLGKAIAAAEGEPGEVQPGAGGEPIDPPDPSVPREMFLHLAEQPEIHKAATVYFDPVGNCFYLTTQNMDNADILWAGETLRRVAVDELDRA